MRIVALFAIAFVYFITPVSAQRLTLEEAVRGQFSTFAPQTLDQLQWFPGIDQYVYVKDTVAVAGNAKKGEHNMLTLAQLNKLLGPNKVQAFPQMKWTSPTEFHFEDNRKEIFVDLKTSIVTFTPAYNEKAQNVEFNVAQRQFAYTLDNDLYATVDGKEVRITTNPQGVVSGQSISRNEYGISKGIFWSEDGSKIAFYQKNESNVTEYPLTDYTTTPAKVKNIKYPMAGGPSEEVSVGVYDIATAKTIYIDATYGQINDKYYLTNLSWGPDHRTIYLAWLNRQTNVMQFKSFDANTGKEIRILFTEKDEKWLEPQHPAIFIPGRPEQFLWMSNRDGFDNLYYYHTSGTLIGQTKFAFDILEVLGFSAKGDMVYVSATGENPTERHTYIIQLSDMSAQKVTSTPGSHHALVSPTGALVLDEFSSITVPYEATLFDFKGKVNRTLLKASDPYAGKIIGKTEIFTIKSNTGEDLYCRLIKPSNFDPSKKYPVVVYLYNGPHVQLVVNEWMGGASLWMHYLAEDGFLVFTVDGHGSDNRGKAFEQAIHRQLGTQEIEDQMSGVNWLKQQPYVDANRMGIHGWSFGGFMTTSMMLRKPDTFKVGVAGGPVIDWRLYEVMYTERYMDTPDENPEGYKTADLTGYVKNLKGKLLMIHGTDDDVVVMQHNMRFQKACVDQGVQVDFFAYPGHQHNVRGRDRVHLMRKVIDYLENGLK